MAGDEGLVVEAVRRVSGCQFPATSAAEVVALGGVLAAEHEAVLSGNIGRLRKRGHGARNVVVAEVLVNQRRRNPSVVRCYAALWWLGACMSRRVAWRSRQMASPVRNGVS